jgi:hypothetical protein
MTLIALPAFSDHTIWMLHDGRQAIGDPGGAAPLQAAPHANGLALAAILVSRRRLDRIVHHRSANIIQKERPTHLRARRLSLPDASPAQAAQECTHAACPSQWKNRIR